MIRSLLSKSSLLFVAIISIILFGWIMQKSLILNCDISWLTYAAKKMLAGGSYTQDFFETNTPMTMYVSVPAIFIQNIFAISIITATRIYIFLLASLSLILCYYSFQTIFTKQEKALWQILLATLAIIYFVLPTNEFGERSHLLVILTMPYLLTVTNRLQHHQVNRYFAIGVGVLAAVGFSLKPFFLFTFAFIEMYCILYQKRFFSWVRTETVTILIIMILYTASAFILFPDYFSVVVPFVMRTYYHGFASSYTRLLTYPEFLFFSIPILLYAALYRKNPYPIFSTILLLALLGFMLSYILQRITIPYHLFPALSISILMVTFFFSLILRLNTLNWLDYCLILFTGGIAFLLSYHSPSIWILYHLSSSKFFCYFFILFSLLLYDAQKSKNIYYTLLSAGTIIAIGMFFSHLITSDNWNAYSFSSTVLILFLSFTLFVSAQKNHKLRSLFIASLGAVLFLYPWEYMLTSLYGSRPPENSAVKTLLPFVNKYAARQPIYMFSTTMDSYPLVDYAHIDNASRFSFFWMIPGMIKQAAFSSNPKLNRQLNKDKDFLTQMVAEDMNRYKPKLVFVDISRHKNAMNYVDINFLDYFNQNAQFKIAWAPYHYLSTITIKSDNLFLDRDVVFAVYQR